MSTRRKAHTDHYHTNPAPPHEPALQPKKHPASPGGARPFRSGPPDEGAVRAGDRARHALSLHCTHCESRIAVLADQHVPVCPHCGGTAFRTAV